MRFPTTVNGCPWQHLFWSRHTRLLVCASDSPLVKREKIKILLALCNLDNHQALLREFIVRVSVLPSSALSRWTPRVQDYADDPDSTVVADAVSAIGQCARRVPACAQQCISALLTMIKSRNGKSYHHPSMSSRRTRSSVSHTQSSWSGVPY